jgi:tetratricopeptide (TPR) repeat protein
MSDFPQESEIDAQLHQLSQKASELIDKSVYRTSFNLYGDLRQKAKRERRLFFYVLGTFHQMDQAQYLFEFQTMRERAIELIALLESEEQCRKIQPDMPIQLFEGLAYQFSSCAYENLAEATGQMEGYNSEGLQACISDGIQICRQTGKMSCIGCFREYSCDVYMSADDSEFAQHQCNMVLDESAPLSSRGDRRWLARKKVAWMTFLEGRTQTAIDMYRDALRLTEAEDVNLKLESQLRTMYELDALLILTGHPAELELSDIATQQPPIGECPLYDLQKAFLASLNSVMKKDFVTAAAILVEWDRLLQEKLGTHLWFEVRLRMIAIKLLAGEAKIADRLAVELEQRARQANDWLTLRRLTALQDPDLVVSPLACFGREVVDASRPSIKLAASTIAEDDEADGNAPAMPPVTPYGEHLQTIGKMFETVSEDALLDDLKKIRTELQSIDVATVDHEHDACTLIHMMGYALGDCSDAAAIWKWANQLAKNFQESPAVLSMLGDLGNQLRFGPNEEFGQTITSDRLEPLFRKAIQLKDAGTGTHMRAGDHFMAEQNFGEAERCYARSFRLKRDNGDAAIKLATLYRDTDRMRDALHVLDVCIREGADVPQVAWEAGITAFALNRFEVMLTYLDRYKAAVGEQPWVDYYRATGLLEQGEPEAALAAIELEQDLFKDPGFHLQVIRGCAQAALGKRDLAIASLQAALAMQLSDIDYLSAPGIAALLLRARNAARDVLEDASLLAEIEQRMLEAYMAPEDLFEPRRLAEEPLEVHFYQCIVRQPLDENWESFAGRQSQEQEDGEFYLGTWGVLAEDETQAQQLVLEWQSRCYPLMAEVVEVSEPTDTFVDSPGVVWQGQRAVPQDGDEDPFDDELDD